MDQETDRSILAVFSAIVSIEATKIRSIAVSTIDVLRTATRFVFALRYQQTHRSNDPHNYHNDDDNDVDSTYVERFRLDVLI